MGLLNRLFGKKDEGLRAVPGAVACSDKASGKVVYNMLDPMMSQFMGRCVGAVKKVGIKAKGTGQFSILLGEGQQQTELPLDKFWTAFQEAQDQNVFASVAELAQRMMQVGHQPTVEQLYPYVIPDEYLKYQQTEPKGIVKPLGHGLHVGLVFDLSGLVESLNSDNLTRLGMTPEQAHARAIQNLKALANAQQIKMAVYPEGPSGRPFVLVGGHWAAATAILLPNLKKVVAEPLSSSDILASVPHREAMLLFPMGDRTHRDAMRAMIKEKESDGAKPLTFELFALTDGGAVAWKEDT